MTPELHEVEQKALRLSAEDRETLVEGLLSSLSAEIPPDIERAWIHEAQRHPSTQDEIREAQAAYDAGDFVTLDEYLARSDSRR
jgi:hypothetical protein